MKLLFPAFTTFKTSQKICFRIFCYYFFVFSREISLMCAPKRKIHNELKRVLVGKEIQRFNGVCLKCLMVRIEIGNCYTFH